MPHRNPRYENIARKIQMENAVTDTLIESMRFDHVEVNENGIIVSNDGFTVIYRATDARFEEE